MPAPDTLPILIPTFKPSFFRHFERISELLVVASISSQRASFDRVDRSEACSIGKISRCPALYGYFASITNECSNLFKIKFFVAFSGLFRDSLNCWQKTHSCVLVSTFLVSVMFFA